MPLHVVERASNGIVPVDSMIIVNTQGLASIVGAFPPPHLLYTVDANSVVLEDFDSHDLHAIHLRGHRPRE